MKVKAMKKINLITIFIMFFVCVGILFGNPPKASAGLFDGSRNAACSGSQLQEQSTGLGQVGQELTSTGSCDAKASSRVSDLIKTAINLLSIAIGVVSVIMIIIGGLKFITSQGEGSNVASARNTILYAIIGLVVVAMAQIVVKFVLTRAVK